MKYLFITSHLSTGGSPKYLEWLIKKIKFEGNEVKVIEWNLYSDQYVIQRNSIINIIGADNFYSVGFYFEDDLSFYSKNDNIINYIKEYNPDFIHLNEFSENFAIKQLPDIIINFLYHKERTHKLLETTHSFKSDILNKKNIPDELWMVCKYQYDIAKKTTIKSLLVEMDVPKRIKPNRKKTLQSLGLDCNKIHVLQVGLFCINKNQNFTFKIANQFINNANIEFHFIGNNCYIDECNINKDLKNCRIWGERSDVDVFMSCMDIFVMPSLEELNPIALKEALSWDMDCFIFDLITLKDKYINNKKINFIKDNNLQDHLLLKCSQLPSSKNIELMNLNKKQIESNKIICSFYPNPKIEILGTDDIDYEVKFIDKKTNIEHLRSKINTNMWTACSIVYFCDWRVIVINNKTGFETIFDLNLNNKIVRIVNESNSLGDAIAWMSVVDEFQKFHNCQIDYFTCKKDIFKSQYTNINFYNYSDDTKKDYYIEYKIGCFNKINQSNLTPSDWRSSNLQKIAFDILGLNFSNIKTNINISNKYEYKYKKYVCIATQSTSQSRYWNLKGGWEKIVQYLKEKDYHVICVDKYKNFGSNEFLNTCPKNIDYFAGEHSFEDVIDIINKCEFFIGLSSGLSWVAWSLDKKIIKINNSVNPGFEFYTPYIVHNKNVCNGCFTNENHVFDARNWSWCPENKNFECSKEITFEMVKEKIDNCIIDLTVKNNN